MKTKRSQTKQTGFKVLLTLAISSVAVTESAWAIGEAYHPERQSEIIWVEQIAPERFTLHISRGEKIENVARGEFAMTVESINGISRGWNLYQEGEVSRHCYVDGLYENGTVIGFCDFITTLPDGARPPIRIRVNATTDKFVPQLTEYLGLKKGQSATLKTPVAHIKAGKEVVIRAIFNNGTALIQESSYFSSGPDSWADMQIVGLSVLSAIR